MLTSLLPAAHFEIMKLTWDQEKRLQDQRDELIADFKMQEWRSTSAARRSEPTSISEQELSDRPSGCMVVPESADPDSEAARGAWATASSRGASQPVFAPVLPLDPRCPSLAEIHDIQDSA